MRPLAAVLRPLALAVAGAMRALLAGRALGGATGCRPLALGAATRPLVDAGA